MALIPEATAGPYWVGDIPAPFTVTFTDDDYNPADLTGTTITAKLRLVGLNVTRELTVTHDAAAAAVTFPGESLLTVPGLYDVEFHMAGTGWAQDTEPLTLVVQAHDGWLTLSQARRGWADAKELDDVLLFGLLDSARRACLAYAPALDVDEDGDVILPLPAGYTEAQLMQARNTWNATSTDPQISGDDQLFVVRPYPLDNFIKQLLRPRSGKPVVF